jgi:hypothetical protein
MKKGCPKQSLLIAALIAGLAGNHANAQQATPPTSARIGAGVPQDWSQRALVYGNALTEDEAQSFANARQWQVRYRDPRYVLSVARRLQATTTAGHIPRTQSFDASSLSARSPQHLRDSRRGHPRSPAAAPESDLVRDWSNVLGGGSGNLGGRGTHGLFPAKYTFDILAEPDCSNDFVVYPTNEAGASQANPVFETYVSSFTGNPGQGSNRTITVGTTAPRQVVLTSSDSSNTGRDFLTSGVSNSDRAQNLRDAINRWTSQTGFRAESDGAQVTVLPVSAGDTANNALVETLNNFAGGSSWAGVNGGGTPGQPTVIAFNQLYQGTAPGACNGDWNVEGATKAPNVSWAYNTGSGYIAETSPVLSYHDGAKQVAFLQRNGNALQLVLLKWKAGEGSPGAPATPPVAANASDYRQSTGACSASSACMFVMGLAGTSNAGNTPTFSSPFVDYAGDVLWVGDGNGRLHKFTGVFKGDPAEVTTGGFPATVAAGMKLSPPVYFAGSVYVGSQSGGAGVGGRIHRVDAASGSVASSTKVANDTTTGFRESPFVVVHGNSASIYGFVFNDGTSGDGSACQPTPDNNDACRVVVRFASGFANAAEPAQKVYVGRGNSAVSTLYGGAFDEAFYSSADGTGAMYIVGGAIADTFVPTLWKIPIIAGAMGAPLPGRVVGSNDCNAVGDCLTNTWDWSPVTVIKNGDNEYLYFSMGKKGNLSSTGCTEACLYMFNLADLNGPSTGGIGALWGAGNTAWAGLQVYGGTGGIIVDNVSDSTGASQVYFAHTAAPGNAVQASQSALE